MNYAERQRREWHRERVAEYVKTNGIRVGTRVTTSETRMEEIVFVVVTINKASVTLSPESETLDTAGLPLPTRWCAYPWQLTMIADEQRGAE